jgi:cytochrome b561
MAIDPKSRYGAVAQAFHWLTATVVLVAFIYGLGGPEQRVYAPSRDAERQLHETLGVAVFILVVLRVLWRSIDRRPEPEPVARWMGIAATAVQALLYVLLFSVPMTAVAGAWLEGHPLSFLGGVELGPPFGTSHALGARLASVHPWLADAMMWIAGLHAVAALFHHLVLKDGVLASMLPRWLLAAPRHPD